MEKGEVTRGRIKKLKLELKEVECFICYQRNERSKTDMSKEAYNKERNL